MPRIPRATVKALAHERTTHGRIRPRDGHLLQTVIPSDRNARRGCLQDAGLREPHVPASTAASWANLRRVKRTKTRPRTGATRQSTSRAIRCQPFDMVSRSPPTVWEVAWVSENWAGRLRIRETIGEFSTRKYRSRLSAGTGGRSRSGVASAPDCHSGRTVPET